MSVSGRPGELSTVADESEGGRTCRFCLDNEVDGDEGELVAPCHCAGGQKWVHVACLRRWQRGIVAQLPTSPQLHSPESRQRICNVCRAPFTIAPPTQTELLQSLAGRAVADLIAEGSLIGSHRDFSSALQRQVAALPTMLRNDVGHQHRIAALFLVVRIARGSGRTVCLCIGDNGDLDAFAHRLEDGWMFEMNGRRMRIVRDGDLAAVTNAQNLPDDADAATVRRAVLGLQAPVVLTLTSTSSPDDGEDAVVAVNLNRGVDLHSPTNRCKRRTFNAAMRAALGRGEELLVDVAHFLGGPCDDDEVVCCIVVGGAGPEQPYVVRYGGLPRALQEAQAKAKAAGISAASTEPLPAAKRRRGVDDAAPDNAATPTSAAAGTDASATADSMAIVEEQAEERQDRAPDVGAVRLLVFWGAAGWSRKQLLGEIVRGSWGLCRSTSEDICASAAQSSRVCLQSQQSCRASLWDATYHRLRFAPRSELSEDFALRQPTSSVDSSEASDDADEVEEDAELERRAFRSLRRLQNAIGLQPVRSNPAHRHTEQLLQSLRSSVRRSVRAAVRGVVSRPTNAVIAPPRVGDGGSSDSNSTDASSTDEYSTDDEGLRASEIAW
mmetsp:Transcript_11096/g.29420  ORF Transcript_11096/g.29420 Transcript_11096/m.29420 type:complete len:610 (+) Transcript_11096:73-1902(+)